MHAFGSSSTVNNSQMISFDRLFPAVLRIPPPRLFAVRFRPRRISSPVAVTTRSIDKAKQAK